MAKQCHKARQNKKKLFPMCICTSENRFHSSSQEEIDWLLSNYTSILRCEQRMRETRGRAIHSHSFRSIISINAPLFGRFLNLQNVPID